MNFPYNDFHWKDFTPKDRAVLCFLRDKTDPTSPKILLIEKKRGLGAGKVNAPGGKQELDETLQETAIRETTEEVCLTPDDPTHRGVLRFVFTDGYHLEVHIFVSCAWSGDMGETPEAKPFWVEESEIPYHRMWQDDQIWLPAVLDGLLIDAEMIFDDDRMITWDMRISDGRHLTGSLSTE